jgi:hypothetical protein
MVGFTVSMSDKTQSVIRAVMELTIIALLLVIYMGWTDYHTMVEQNQQVKQNYELVKRKFIEDVVGYDYCDRD